MIGIFGGSFDPPHKGHQEIIRKFWEKFPDAKNLLIIPNHISPLKEKKSATKKNILEMLNLMLEGFDQTKNILRKDEIENEKVSYTIDTLLRLRREFGEEEIFLLIGEDNLESFPRWKEYTKILELASLLVFRRKIENSRMIPDSIPQAKILFMNNEIIPASSTEIRDDLRNGKINNYLPVRISDYITKERLYFD
ncbi:MAG: nicotinate (nicotinamide) nucleotide adenylyltransferase [Leptospira sp.]|nr:nicotinate (nicotinamide) nucleotide adenylyltransferase [Leptospira sp.]